jgi:hypothetical protein
MLEENSDDSELTFTSSNGGQGHAVQDEIERLLGIATQLFEAIERHINHIEQELTYVQNQPHDGGYHHVVFKERLLRIASGLNTSVLTTAEYLGDRPEGSSNR